MQDSDESDTEAQVASKAIVSVADLVRAGLLSPGSAVLSVTSKGSTWKADLLADGTMRTDGQVMESPTTLARVLVGQLSTKNGWKCVMYAGRYASCTFCCGLSVRESVCLLTYLVMRPIPWLTLPIAASHVLVVTSGNACQFGPCW